MTPVQMLEVIRAPELSDEQRFSDEISTFGKNSLPSPKYADSQKADKPDDEERRGIRLRRRNRIHVSGERARRIKIVAKRALIQEKLTIREIERGWEQ